VRKHSSGKLLRLDELLETILDEGDRVLIFTQFAKMGELLKTHLQERFAQEVLFLHGALPRSAREKLVLRFQEQNGPAIFVLSLKAGGYGLNLTQANQVIHFDEWWNPAAQDQATDRAYRIGQVRNVQVRKLLCRGTLEERIHELLMKKREIADSIVGTTKNVLTEMSTSELEKLLTLTTDLDAMEEGEELPLEY
jgi:SNF2 family DNA or RNA helicase